MNLSKQIQGGNLVKAHILENMTMLVNEMIEKGILDYEPETEDEEVMEWWLVSDWLAKKLEARKEVVINYADFNYFWGRQCSGQAIKLDTLIQDIAKEYKF